MNRLARRHFLTRATALTASSLATGLTGQRALGQSAEFKLKFASNLPAVHPLNVRAKEAAEAILKESGGRVDIQVFPNNQLGSDTDMLSQVRSGAIDFFTLSGLILSTAGAGSVDQTVSVLRSRTMSRSGRRWTATSVRTCVPPSPRPTSWRSTRSGTTGFARSPVRASPS